MKMVRLFSKLTHIVCQTRSQLSGPSLKLNTRFFFTFVCVILKIKYNSQ
jgi:hypothetical protein